MCEESACLVPPLADPTHNGSSEPRVQGAAVVAGSPGGSGSALGGAAGGGQALVGFHEDALAQAAVGRAQLLLALVLGLALAADCGELAVLGFVLPAAELQLCIGTHRKNWLGSISLLALALGSVAWGVLGDRLGRRRALMSALSVAALFSAVAAVMPTYGTFMTARFCSGLGVAGAVPLSFAFLAEACPRATRTRYTGLLHACWPLGALFTSTLAHLTLPSDGVQTVLDSREHWSSWHRLLLLNTLPIIACIVGLVWASESPRYLLEASREVEALQVYQRFHRLNKARTQYGLTELELPSRSAYRDRPVSPARTAFGHGMDNPMSKSSQEHWSSWHRLLLLNTLPIIACIVGLVWASESPRYLLEASREVEALQVYQRFHRLNKARTQYGLTELELPSRSAYRDRPVSPARTAFGHGMDTFREAFLRISSPPHMRTTLLLACVHVLVGFCYTGVSVFAPALSREMHEEQYAALTRHVHHANFTGGDFNSTVENVRYIDTAFHNVTFSKVVFSHVNFINCDFYESEFSNVKSSRTYFENSTIRDSRFIDTDLTETHFIHCTLVNNTFLTLVSECGIDFDYNIYLHDLYVESVSWAAPMVPALLLVGFALGSRWCSRPLLATGLLLLAGLSAIGIFFLRDFVSVLVVEALLKVLMMCAMNAIIVATVEAYPCHLRCTAHGIMRSLYHLAALLAIPLYTSLIHVILLFPAAITLGILFLAAVLATRIQDNSKVLL